MDIIFFFQSSHRASWRKKLAGVYRYAREHDWFVHVIESSATGDDIRRALRDWRPIGCLVDCALHPDRLRNGIIRNMPVVYLDHPRAARHAQPCLTHDSAAEASLAGQELFRLGCRSYAYFGTGQRYFWDTERLDRFRLEARKIGKSVRDLPRSGIKAALQALPKPCGILAANDRCALEIYQAATSAGFSIPEDVAIAGIDNDELLCESVSPGITSAEPDFEGAGYRLAEILHEEIRRGTRRTRSPHAFAKETYGPRRIVRRGSTAPATGTTPRVRRALEYIRRHACERTVRLDDVAREMNCSRRLATLRFRNETGLSILSAIRDERLRKACDLLSRSSLPIETVTALCGYDSSSFFKREFRKRTGMTMREWRKGSGQRGRSSGQS